LYSQVNVLSTGRQGSIIFLPNTDIENAMNRFREFN